MTIRKPASRASHSRKAAPSALQIERHRALVKLRRCSDRARRLLFETMPSFQWFLDGERQHAGWKQRVARERKEAIRRATAGLFAPSPPSPPPPPPLPSPPAPLPSRPSSVKEWVRQMVADVSRKERESRAAYARRLARVAMDQGYAALTDSKIDRALRNYYSAK
jgi:hypothetical protein